METLPSYVKVMLGSFGEERESGVLRTPMESGPPKQLKVKSRVLVSRPVVLRVESKTNYLALIAWFETNINLGADWFTWSDPVSGTSKSARFVSKLDAARPTAALGGGWEIGATLETWSA